MNWKEHKEKKLILPASVPPGLPDQPRLFVGLPTYDGRRYNTQALMNIVPYCAEAHMAEEQGSLLAHVFNLLWVQALDRADAGQCDAFLLLHDDIMPAGQDWFERYWQVFKESDADMMAMVSPLKDGRGLTSTAVEGDDLWNPRRLTLHEIETYPVTFTVPGLLINSGTLLCNLTRNLDKWSQMYFTIRDAIVRWPDGGRRVMVRSEDWEFSRQARRQGLKVMATRAVPLRHAGHYKFPSTPAWGAEQTDTRWAQIEARSRFKS